MNKPQFARGVWLFITFALMLFYLFSAWAYQRVLLTEPFLGSTVQSAVNDLAVAQTGLARWGLSLDAYAWILISEQTLITIACCILSFLIVWRRPTDRFAWGMSFIFVIIGTQIPVQAMAIGHLYPAWEFLGFTTNQIGTATNVILLWIFPNGNFIPGWSVWTFITFILIGVFATLYPNGAFATISIPIAILLFCSAVVAQIYRYLRVSGPIERQQTKWGLFALTVAPATWIVSAFLLPMVFPGLVQNSENAAPYNLLRLTFGNFGNFLIPLAIGLSILRYRLWDIDILIRRTLQYTLLSGLLALAYFGGIVILQEILGPLTGEASSPLITVLTTLGIAALFNPLRRRVQEFIDRRFFRNKYNAEQTLANFSIIARDEVDMEKLTAELLRVVGETMQPARVSIWLKQIPRHPKTGLRRQGDS